LLSEWGERPSTERSKGEKRKRKGESTREGEKREEEELAKRRWAASTRA
jgi:hypothetical protein